MSKDETLKYATIAVNRFGLGARPGELKEAQSDPRAWVLNQLVRTPNVKPPITTIEAIADFVLYQKYRGQQRKIAEAELAGEPIPEADIAEADIKQPVKEVIAQSENMLLQSIGSQSSVYWRLLNFFSNHFSVTANSQPMRFAANSFEAEAIAPHILGNFSDLLRASTQHPAMLLYLNNEASIGPDSFNGLRQPDKGLNENLAREILELHTLGVNGGYNLKDIQELAMAITGWTIDRSEDKGEKIDGFLFNRRYHQTGTRQLLGKSYSGYPELIPGQNFNKIFNNNMLMTEEVGLHQGEEILRDLAVHPSTAKFVSRKLAVHFVSDRVSESLISNMTSTWLETGGHISSVMKTLINDDSAWDESFTKFKTPRDFFVSALRSSGLDLSQKIDRKEGDLYNSLKAMGQAPFNANSPEGYGDLSMDWDGSSALMARASWSMEFVPHVRVPALEVASTIFGDSLSSNTVNIIKRAESQQQALALLFMSPEFQRR